MERDMKYAPGASGNGTYLLRQLRTGMYARTVRMLQKRFGTLNRKTLCRRMAVRALEKLVMTIVLAAIIVLPMCLFDMFINFVMGW